MKLSLWTATILASLVQAVTAEPAEPYRNPHLALSSYPVTHMMADFAPQAGPVGPGRSLNADEVQWQPVGPINGWTPLYSSPYPNGKRVIWVGGYDRVAKLDADTLNVLTTYAIGGNTYFGREEIDAHITNMDQLDDKGMLDYNMKLWEKPFASVVSFYRMLSRDNELYIPHRAADGTISLRVYGEADANDPSSEILLQREWKIPADVSRADAIMGINMTPDGWIVMATMDGAVIILSQDFTTYHAVKMPSRHDEKAEQDINRDVLTSFLRNGLTIDDKGGIYVVTRDYMQRVQWTGEKLSLNETDGAWKVPYPNELGTGSGTTPGLVGWGSEEDHLIVVADGSRSNKLMAFWRDTIPDDWKGLPGYDRRVAGITPIQFGVSDDEQVLLENAPVIYGYGIFFNNNYPVQRLPDQGSRTRQWLAESFYIHVPGHGARGGAQIRWDPQHRKLETAWNTQANLASAVCTISGATEILYCWGSRDRKWVLEGMNWNTGESTFTYTLGESHRFNPMGGLVIVAPNGAIDCACVGGLGIVRVNPN